MADGIRDLGIHLDCHRLPIFGFGTMSAEDREIRRRLFWSAYTWDKVSPAADRRERGVIMVFLSRLLIMS